MIWIIVAVKTLLLLVLSGGERLSLADRKGVVKAMDVQINSVAVSVALLGALWWAP